MSLIKLSGKMYEELRVPRMCRLRRSSRRPEIESQYIKKYNTEEHLIYRTQEIRAVYQIYQYYKLQDEITYWLSKKCGLYNKETVYSLIGCYLVGETEEPYSSYESKKIMELRLNIKDKNMTKGEMYIMCCGNLPDTYSYNILTNM